MKTYKPSLKQIANHNTTVSNTLKELNEKLRATDSAIAYKESRGELTGVLKRSKKATEERIEKIKKDLARYNEENLEYANWVDVSNRFENYMERFYSEVIKHYKSFGAYSNLIKRIMQKYSEYRDFHGNIWTETTVVEHENKELSYHRKNSTKSGGFDSGKEIENIWVDFLKEEMKCRGNYWEPNGGNTFPDFQIVKDNIKYPFEIKSMFVNKNKDFVAGMNIKEVLAMMKGDITAMNTPIIIQDKKAFKEGRINKIKTPHIRIYPAVMLIKYDVDENGNVFINMKSGSTVQMNEKQLYENNWSYEDCERMIKIAKIK